MKFYVVYLFTFFALPGISSGFQFDRWTSGISIREVMAVAKDKDIPIHREGLFSGSKGFNPNVSTKYIGTAHDFYYREKLLGENAKVNLISLLKASFSPR